jgi:hypothetical protein
MRRLFTYVCLTVLGIFLWIFLLGGLFGSFSSLLTAAFIATLMGLMIYAEKQERRREDQQKKLEEQRKEEELRKQRLQAINNAREKPNLFTFNPSNDLEDISGYEQQGDPVKWAEALQRHYEVSTSALNDAILVVNDDIEQLYQYRANLKQGILRDYENAISPFKSELLLLENEIPQPKALKAAENYTFPASLQPTAIQKELYLELNSVASGVGSKINTLVSISGGWSNIKNINKGAAAITVVFVGIELAIAEVRRRKMSAEKLTELQALQADIYVCCEEISAAIKGLGMAAVEVAHLRQLHDDTVDYLMQNYDYVKMLSGQNKSLDDLEKSEVKVIESFYVGGKRLARLIQVDITKPKN